MFQQDSQSDTAIPRGGGKGWYNYDPVSHVISPIAGKVLIIKTHDGKLGRYNVYMDNLWVAGVYNMSDSEDEMMDKMELGLGYSFNVWKSLSIDPYYVIPMKENEAGEREGKFNLGLSYKF